MLISNFLRSLHILEMSSLSDVGLVRTFFLFCRLTFCPIDGGLCLTETFPLHEVPFSVLPSACAIAVLFLSSCLLVLSRSVTVKYQHNIEDNENVSNRPCFVQSHKVIGAHRPFKRTRLPMLL